MREPNVVNIRPSFLAIYLMVLCLSLHLADLKDLNNFGYSLDEAGELSRNLFSAVQVIYLRQLASSIA